MHIYFGFGAYGKDAYGMSLGALFASRVTCILKPRFIHILYTFGIHSQRYSDSLNTTCIHTHTHNISKKNETYFVVLFGWMQFLGIDDAFYILNAH